MGGKKHKKKIYNTPKVISHRHNTLPLASLKMYGVDNENNIIVSKKVCPMTECGEGIFMASHNDRYYCGKCHFVINRNSIYF